MSCLSLSRFSVYILKDLLGSRFGLKTLALNEIRLFVNGQKVMNWTAQICACFQVLDQHSYVETDKSQNSQSGCSNLDSK